MNNPSNESDRNTEINDKDEETATTAPLADLTVSDKQAEQAKGGPTKRVWDYIRVPY